MVMNGLRFDMFEWQVVPWSVMFDDVRYLEALGVGTVWIGDTYVMPPSYGDWVLEAWTTLAALASSRSESARHDGQQHTPAPPRNAGQASGHGGLHLRGAARSRCRSWGQLQRGNSLAWPPLWLPEPALTVSGRRWRLSTGCLRGHEVTFHGEYYHLDQATLSPAPVQRPRPPLAIAAQGRRGLRVAAEYADIWVTMPSGKTAEEAQRSVQERNLILEEQCAELGRDPETIERACLAGWSGPDRPFASADAFQDFVGRYREAGMQRFIFSLGSEAFPNPYEEWIATGAWATRDSLKRLLPRRCGGCRAAARTYTLTGASALARPVATSPRGVRRAWEKAIVVLEDTLLLTGF